MRWASAISTAERFDLALDQALESVATQLEETAPDLVFVHATPAHRHHFAELQRVVRQRLGGPRLLGCSAAGVIGDGREIEHGPALSLTAAVLPGVDLHLFHLSPNDVPTPTADARKWHEALGAAMGGNPHFILLPDPFSCDVERILSGMDEAFPDAVKVGGLASGGRQPGQTALWVDDDVHNAGMVGVMLDGNVCVDTIVAQGCRPIGNPMFVTRAEQNIVYELDGRPPVDLLDELYAQLPEHDQQLMRYSLFLGLVSSETQQVYEHGDFLVRNILGIDREHGSIVVGARLHLGRVVQFHLRDSETSSLDLDRHLQRYVRDETPPPAGGLLYACLGRGEGLYGEPDFDCQAFERIVGPVPLGGFFCAGELGPVQGTTHLHGYTSSFALFRPRRAH